MNWLVKTDPDEYTAADLERDGRTRWTGVRNPAARKGLAAMQPDEPVLVYHTGQERAIVALARVTAAAADSATEAVPELAFDRWLRAPLTLAQIKSDPAFADFALVRQTRLSVMAVSAEHWRRLLALEPRR
jgi:predicted RNA-binding protein with PUA-like domain